MRGEEGNRGMKGGRGEEGSRGHANGKLYCRKTNIESAAGSAEGESSRCLLFILGPTSVAEFLPRYACGYVCGFTSASSPRASVPSPFSFNFPSSLRGRSTKQRSSGFCFLLRKEGPPTGSSREEGGDTNICSSGFVGFEILTNPGWILSVIVDRNCFSSK